MAGVVEDWEARGVKLFANRGKVDIQAQNNAKNTKANHTNAALTGLGG